MEASQAAGGDAAQQDGQQAAQQQGSDVTQIAQQLEQMQAGQEELRTFLTSEPWKQEVAQAQEQEPETDLSWLDPAAAEYDPQQFAAQIQEAIKQEAQRITRAEIEPLRNEWQEDRIQREAQELSNEFPEMQDEQVANEVVSVARQLAEMNGQPELAAQPWFWRLTYMAGRAAESANAEGADSPRAAHLEGGGGAGPAGGSEVDPAELIVGARRGASVLPF